MTICLLLTSQTGSNPFDIQGRTSSEVMQVDAIDEKTEDQVVDDQTNVIQPTEPESQPFNSTTLTGTNPFNVDHVPIRRSEARAAKAKQKAAVENKKNPKLGKSFVFWVNLVIWGLLALVLAQERQIIANLWKAMLNENLLKLHKRDTGVDLGNLILYMIYFLGGSMFIYLLYAHYNPNYQPYLWVKILGALVALYLARHFFYMIFGATFKIQKEVSLYNYVIYIANILIGIALIPINLLLAFGPEGLFNPVMYLGLVVISILLILRYLRGLTISIKFISSSFLLFFMYLCIAEISPILLFYKAFLA